MPPVIRRRSFKYCGPVTTLPLTLGALVTALWVLVLQAHHNSTVFTTHLSVNPSILSHPVTVNDVIVMVVTGAAHHQDRLVPILHTWAQWLPPDRLIIVSDVEDVQLGTYMAPETGGGHGPSQKKWFHGVLEVLRVLRGGLKAKWICVVDDDTFLFVPNLLRLLDSLDSFKSAIYGEICSLDACDGPCICGGGGWVAPTQVFLELAEAFETYGAWPPPCCAEMYCSDQIISKWMNTVGNVTLVQTTEFKPFPPDLYTDSEKMRQHLPTHMVAEQISWRNIVSFHYVGSGLHGTSNDVSMELLYHLASGFSGSFLKERS